MTKTAPHFTPLPAGVVPSRPTHKTVAAWTDRGKADGTSNKSMVIDVDGALAQNNLSNWRKKWMPMGRILPLAKAAGVSEEELEQFLHDFFIELHGKKTAFDLEALIQYAVFWSKPRGDEGKLLGLWRVIIRTEESDPTHALDGLLDDPAVLDRVRRLILAIRDEHLAELRVA